MIYNPPPRLAGETFDAFELRLKAAHAEQSAPRHVSQLSPAEIASGYRDLASGRLPTLLPTSAPPATRDIATLPVSELTRDERVRRARQLGIPLHNSIAF